MINDEGAKWKIRIKKLNNGDTLAKVFSGEKFAQLITQREVFASRDHTCILFDHESHFTQAQTCIQITIFCIILMKSKSIFVHKDFKKYAGEVW